MQHPTRTPDPSTAQARYIAHLIRDRVIDENNLEDDAEIVWSNSGAARLQISVVIMLDPATAVRLMDPPAEFDDLTECPIAGHAHDPVGIVGAFDERVLMECRTTLHQWEAPRPVYTEPQRAGK